MNELIVKDAGENFDLGLFFLASNTNRIIDYLNKFESEEIDITLLCTIVLNNIKNKPNKNNLFKLIDKKYSPFFKDKTEANNSNTVFGNKVTYNFKKTFHDIVSGKVFKKNRVSKKEIIGKYSIPTGSLAEDSLSVKEVIKINTMNNDFQIIKFHGNTKSILKTNYAVLNNDIVKYNTLLKVLIKMNFEVFINFYSNEKNNRNYPEINKLKPFVKDANGVLNIEKLA
ncbi:hypothetical protein, partial [Tenacibaculum maritimum]|uniref:hypothetical protein n=1 Tax=Tenacibaculum maritimum TaxID=107401 RepID=UPI003875AF13